MLLAQVALCAGTGAELEDSLIERLERLGLGNNVSRHYLVCEAEERVSDEAWKVKLDGVELG